MNIEQASCQHVKLVIPHLSLFRQDSGDYDEWGS